MFTIDSEEKARAIVENEVSDAVDLAAVAYQYPKFHDEILEHDNCYPGLKMWIGHYRDTAPNVGGDSVNVESVNSESFSVVAGDELGSVSPECARAEGVNLGGVNEGVNPDDDPTQNNGWTKSQALDPKTDLYDLAKIAETAPELRKYLALNSSTYPELLKWLATLGDQEINDALVQRGTKE